MLKSLYLRQFRNYKEAEVQFSPRLNVFYGGNAQGKTNLLEAIYLVATGRSFRSQTLSDLIQEGASFFYIEAVIAQGNVEQTVKISFDGQNRRLQMDANQYATFHPLLGILPSVLYTPQDTDLITGSPTERRRFFNLHLAQSDPLYVHHLTRYWRAMKQRNCLLRAKNHSAIDCWENEMAQSASYLFKARHEMVAELQEPLEKLGISLSNVKELHEIRYHPSQAENYLAQLKKNRLRESELGLTLTGPHRDDLSLLIEGKTAKLFASEGQKKTAIAALKFAEWERLTMRVGSPALMGIDDIGLHLDEARQQSLQLRLQELGQVFVTTPIAWKELATAQHIHVANGALKT